MSYIYNLFIFNFFIFGFGILGIIINKHSLILLLMSIELVLLSINVNFLMFSLHLSDRMGELFSILILTVAASEAAIGLAIIIVYYRARGNIFINRTKLLSH
jgi:NADH-quinone oxidoreductase subunit K